MFRQMIQAQRQQQAQPSRADEIKHRLAEMALAGNPDEAERGALIDEISSLKGWQR